MTGRPPSRRALLAGAALGAALAAACAGVAPPPPTPAPPSHEAGHEHADGLPGVTLALASRAQPAPARPAAPPPSAPAARPVDLGHAALLADARPAEEAGPGGSPRLEWPRACAPVVDPRDALHARLSIGEVTRCAMID